MYILCICIYCVYIYMYIYIYIYIYRCIYMYIWPVIHWEVVFLDLDSILFALALVYIIQLQVASCDTVRLYCNSISFLCGGTLASVANPHAPFLADWRSGGRGYGLE